MEKTLIHLCCVTSFGGASKFTHSNVKHTVYHFSLSASKMNTALAAPCTPCDLLYNGVSDDCEDGGDDAPSHLSDWYILSCKKGHWGCPWSKTPTHMI